MARPFTEWTVLPHGELDLLEDNLICASGFLRMPPMGEVERRMTVVRLRDARLVVYSAIALDEAEMTALESFGRPGYLIVPNGLHRMDARIWKERYPGMKVIAPAVYVPSVSIAVAATVTAPVPVKSSAKRMVPADAVSVRSPPRRFASMAK